MQQYFIMDQSSLKQFIKQASFDAGFSAFGVASADPVNELDHLEQWLSNDYCATMRWMERDPKSRCSPHSLLPDAKSVICVALSYGDHGIETSGSLSVSQEKIKKDARARYARGRDYHRTVLEKLEIVWSVVKTRAPHAHAKFCVDTNPILEKALAVRAGLGWQGNNSVIVHPEHGSFFVLGEIITDIALEPDKPIPSQCGDCKRCIDSCPTGAIAHPRVLNAGRCLSYLTLEHKGQIPEEFQKYLKPDQYGCDICQEVCPYNKKD